MSDRLQAMVAERQAGLASTNKRPQVSLACSFHGCARSRTSFVVSGFACVLPDHQGKYAFNGVTPLVAS